MPPTTVQRMVRARDGVPLATYARGDPGAPVVVAVHGYPDDHTVWDATVADLSTDHHVVTYDVRGAGASGAPRDRSGYDLDRLTDDLLTVLDDVAPGRRVHLLAHDWGAIATWHAVTDVRLAGRVASCTSISGPGVDHIGRWFRRRRSRRDVARQQLASWYTVLFRWPVLPELLWRSGIAARVVAAREGVPRPAVRDAVNGLALYRVNLAGRAPDPVPRRTDVPVQVLAPTRDRYVTAPLQTEIADVASDLRVRSIPGGHWLPRTRPGVVARCVRELVAHVEGGPEASSLRRARAGTGRLVVVVGAGGGIGRATALAFARRGAEVVVADRDLAAAEATVRLIAGPASAHRFDGSDAAGFAGRVAAGPGVPDVVVQATGDLWDVVHGYRAFAALLRGHGEGGHLVNVAPAGAWLPGRPSSAARTAVGALSAYLRAELSEDGIGVTTLRPSVFVGAGRVAEAVVRAVTPR